MALIVQKFGGTSVATPAHIETVAKKVAALHAAGNDVVIVVSAMSGETNRLLALAHDIALPVRDRAARWVHGTPHQRPVGPTQGKKSQCLHVRR